MGEPAQVHCLASYLAEELQERGWTTLDVMKRYDRKIPGGWMLLGINLALVNPPHFPIHEEVIYAYAHAFGVSTEFLRSIEHGWRDHPEKRANDYQVDWGLITAMPVF